MIDHVEVLLQCGGGLWIDPRCRQHDATTIVADEIDRMHRVQLRVAVEPRAFDRSDRDQCNRRDDEHDDRCSLAVTAAVHLQTAGATVGPRCAAAAVAGAPRAAALVVATSLVRTSLQASMM